MKYVLGPASLVGFCLLTAASVCTTAEAKPWWMRAAPLDEQNFLDPDVAFRVHATIEGTNVHVHWTIADGYYLYRDKMQLRAESPDLAVDPASWPGGTVLPDPNFGLQHVYFDAVDATTAFHRSDFGAHPMQIKVVYQGCAKAGLCYPPITRVLFPQDAAAPGDRIPPATPSPRWEGVAILGGGGAFLLAGLLLRKKRRLPTPA